MNHVRVLTPPGTGAIATLEVSGPTAWAAVRERFTPANGRPLPDDPELHRTWYGTIDLSSVLPGGAMRFFHPFTTTFVEVRLDREPLTGEGMVIRVDSA